MQEGCLWVHPSVQPHKGKYVYTCVCLCLWEPSQWDVSLGKEKEVSRVHSEVWALRTMGLEPWWATWWASNIKHVPGLGNLLRVVGPYALASATIPPPLFVVADCGMQTGECLSRGGWECFPSGVTGLRKVELQGGSFSLCFSTN